MLPNLFGAGGFPFPLDLTTMSGFSCDNVTDSYNTGGGLRNGADSTGVLDSSAAFAYWIGSTTRGYVFVPPGTYRLQPGIVQFTKAGVTLFGAGYSGSSVGVRIIIDDTLGHSGGDGFLIQDVRNCRITGMTLSAPSARAAGYAVHSKGGDPAVNIATTQMDGNQTCIDVDMDNQFRGVLIDDSTVGNLGTVVGNANREAYWTNFAAGQNAIVVNSPGGASHILRNTFILNPTATVLGGAGIQVLGAGDLRLVDMDVLGYAQGFLLNNTNPIATPVTGGGVCHIMMTACQFDNTGGAVGNDNIRIAPGDITRPINISIANSWCGSGNTGLRLVGFTGANCKLSFDGGAIQGAADFGVKTTGGSVLNTNIFLGTTIKYALNASGNTSIA